MIPLIQTAGLSMYHGSPSDQVDFNNFKGRGAYFTSDYDEAVRYAQGRVAFVGKTRATNPTVYVVTVTPRKTLDLRRHEIKEEYTKRRAVWNAKRNDPDEMLPSLKAAGFIHSGSGLPTWGQANSLRDLFSEYDSIWLAESGNGISLVVFDPKGKVQIEEKISL